MVLARGLYAILDHPHLRGIPIHERVAALLAGGARCVQLRAKNADTRTRVELLRVIGPVCRKSGAALWVNDDPDAATAGIEGITGLHVGQEDLGSIAAPWRERLRAAHLGLGVSTHSLAQVLAAAAHGPAYLGFGPVFSTRGKADADPVVGIEGLAAACSSTPLPVVAIGGIDAGRAAACLRVGATAVAAIGALDAGTAVEIEACTRAMVHVCRAGLSRR